MEGMAPGFVFKPTAQQLINEYLRKKEKGLPLPGQVVVERNLYGESPWEVLKGNHLPWQESQPRDGKSTIYVLTELEKFTENRMHRSAGCGRWHAETRAEKILNDHGDVIGFKRTLVFMVDYNYGADEGLNKGNWIMHEYTLESGNFPFAICKITNDASKKVKRAPNNAPKRKAAVVEEEDVKKRNKKGKAPLDVSNQYTLVEGAEQSTGAPQSHLATNPSTSSASSAISSSNESLNEFCYRQSIW